MNPITRTRILIVALFFSRCGIAIILPAIFPLARHPKRA